MCIDPSSFFRWSGSVLSGPSVRATLLQFCLFRFLAIKKLRELELQGLIKNKQKERWCKEVEIMKKLNHLNVVKAVAIPQELNSLASTPTLAMEFCSLGDLRQVSML